MQGYTASSCDICSGYTALRPHDIAPRRDAMRCRPAANLKHFGNKDGRFLRETCHFLCHCEAAARPWQSLSRRHGFPWRSTGARNKKESLSQKTGDLLHRFAPAFLISRFCFVTRNHSSLRNDKLFRQRLPRRAQKLRPPRNDKSGGFCGKTEQFPERNV